MQCPACGVEAIEQAVYCHKCGARLDGAPGQSLRSSRLSEGAPSENELWRGGYSAKAMANVGLICGIITLCLLVGWIFWAPSLRTWLVLPILMLLPWLYCAAVWAYRHLGVRYSLTSQRFIHETGVLRRVNDRIEVIDIDDISFQQTLMERVLGIGTILIRSHDLTHPKLVLPGIENVAEVASIFDKARLAERERRGLHVEQI